MCRKVFKESSALRYHQIHHPELGTMDEEEEEKVSESQHQQPHVMNGVDGPLIQPHQHMNGLSTSTGGQLG